MNEGNLTLITGASSGIGREIAKRLSSSRRLILHGRDESRLKETLDYCTPGDHVLWNFDLSQVSEIRKSLSSLLVEVDGQISEFVHSAGIPSVSAARMISVSSLQNTMNVNAISAIEICASLLRKNINEAALSRVVFVSSIWSQFGSSGHTAYSASKGALDSAMRSMAVELAPKVRLNSLVLGAIQTPMAAKALSDASIRSHAEANYPLGVGSTNDAADVCEFLLSDSARWITGQSVVVDGGRTAHMSNK
jgi:NAD(P)-dependent dehydrogenase (short-subunit alcohol dehydrogenase family)